MWIGRSSVYSSIKKFFKVFQKLWVVQGNYVEVIFFALFGI
jgi:hypothetical protein